MSFYVWVDDLNNNGITELCGWRWYDFGLALGERGEKIHEHQYKVAKSALLDLFAGVDVLVADSRFEELYEISQYNEGDFYHYFYDCLLGLEEIDVCEDMSKYNEIENPDIAAAVRAADLKYADEKKKEAYERRLSTLAWFHSAVECVEGDLGLSLEEVLKEEYCMFALKEFVDKVRDSACDEFVITLG